MAFKIRKINSFGSEENGVLNNYIKKVSQTEDPSTRESNELNSIILNFKNLIVQFVDEIERVSKENKREPIIPIDQLNFLDDVFDMAKTIEEEFRDQLLNVKMDPENLDLVLDLLEELIISGQMGNSNSRRLDPNLVSTEQVITSLSSLMEANYIPNELESEIPLISEVISGANQNLVNVLISGNYEEREIMLNNYGISLEDFQDFLIDKGYSATTRKDDNGYIPEPQMKRAVINFIQAATSQHVGNKIQLDDTEIKEAILERIKRYRQQLQSNNSVSKFGENAVYIEDLSGIEFFTNYFLSRDREGRSEITPAFSSLMEDLAHYSGAKESILRNVSDPFSQEDTMNLMHIFNALENSTTDADYSKKIEFLNTNITKAKILLDKTPDNLKDRVKKQIDNFQKQKKELELKSKRTNKKLSSTLQFKDKKNKKDLSEIKKLAYEVDIANSDFKENPIDIGALGLVVEKYSQLYNFSDSKSSEKKAQIKTLQDSLMNSSWYRFVFPAYRFTRCASDFIDILNDPLEKTRMKINKFINSKYLIKLNSQLLNTYYNLLSSEDSETAKEVMNNFLTQAETFTNEVFQNLTGYSDYLNYSREDKSPAGIISSQLYMYLNLIRINLNNPESVIFLGKGAQKTSNTSNKYILVKSFRIV